jgi:hypothetical protein
MPTYATVADFEAYSEGWVTTDVAALTRAIERAERDVDRLLGYRGHRVTATVKLDPATLTAFDRDALKRATCAQTEYRIEMGPRFFRQAQHRSVSGPKFSTEGQLPRIGPKVMEELAGTSLVAGRWSTVLR